jgi:hypothetical protein
LSSLSKHFDKNENSSLRSFNVNETDIFVWSIAKDKLRSFIEIGFIDLIAWIITITIFLMYFYQIVNVSDQILYYFYTTVTQVFAAILGIIAAFGILVKQKYEDESKIKRDVLKNGIKGFLIIYTAVILLSVNGILISSSVASDNISLFQKNPDITTVSKNLIYPINFELTFLMAPIALLYLYSMIIDFLKLDNDKEDENKKIYNKDVHVQRLIKENSRLRIRLHQKNVERKKPFSKFR